MLKVLVLAAVAFTAAVGSAVAVGVVIVVVTVDVGVVGEFIFEEGFYGCICVSGYTAVEFDADRCQGVLGTAADTAADQSVYLVVI